MTIFSPLGMFEEFAFLLNQEMREPLHLLGCCLKFKIAIIEKKIAILYVSISRVTLKSLSYSPMPVQEMLRETGLIPESERLPGDGNGNLLSYLVWKTP